MYVNQIDSTIDKMLDNMYLDMNSVDLFLKIKNTLNFVEFLDEINNFIQTTIEKIDLTALNAIVNNKENITKIIYIFKRYVTYYFFLSVAFYYKGEIKDFRNNIIQFTKLQLNSKYLIKNFFDSENNYQVIKYFKVIKDCINILKMTELQVKTLDRFSVKDAINFLNNLGKEYINNYILSVDKNDEVVVNTHNLIKTIVFREVYIKQEQSIVFEIVNEKEESELEYRYIDIVINNDDVFDINNLSELVDNYNNNIIIQDLAELLNQKNKNYISLDKNNNNLISLKFIIPIVDDFLRYHRDSEKIEIENNTETQLYLNNKTTSKNIQYLILDKQRKKKMNPKAQAIVTKLDLITDLYSTKNIEIINTIEKHFYQPMKSRKIVLTNYLEELKVTSKIVNLGKKAIEKNEYFLELNEINSNAYFNFKDFKKYGTEILLETISPINMVRYSNIENAKVNTNSEIECRSGRNEHIINLVGLTIGPFGNELIQCVKKREMINIRNIEINYPSTKVSYKNKNAFKMFLKIIKYFYIDSISLYVGNNNNVKFYVDYTSILTLNPKLRNLAVYWIYDIEIDIFYVDTYESAKLYNSTEYIKLMNVKLYERIQTMFLEKLYKIIENNKNYSLDVVNQIITKYIEFTQLSFDIDKSREFIINEYLFKKPLVKSNIKSHDIIEKPLYTQINDKTYLRINIDMRNPYEISKYLPVEFSKNQIKENKENKEDIHCQHEVEWIQLNKFKQIYNNLNKYNLEITKFIEKYAMETKETDFICNICGQILKIKTYVLDGNFDNTNQRFISTYMPSNISLETIKEYKPYTITLKFLEHITNKISLISGTNVFIGNAQNIIRQKALVKSTIDIILKHNSINLVKNVTKSKNILKLFNINEDYDSLFFFELDDKIFDSSEINNQFVANNINLNKLKLNNIYLYFILMFITELNGAQISMMYFDKIANIYVFLESIDKIIGDLKIKKNLNSSDTVFLRDYPILSYLIFLMSYYFTKYNFWYYPSKKTNSFNPLIQKNIIHSFIHLVNSIIIDGDTYQSDYIYIFTISRFYSQLNTVFKNMEIIKLLKLAHIKYSKNKNQLDNKKQGLSTENDVIYYIKNPFKEISITTKIPTYKISNGIIFSDEQSLNYIIYPTNNSNTNCITGDFHKWNTLLSPMVCLKCHVSIDDVKSKQLTVESYYFNLNKIAQNRCLDGKFHDFSIDNNKIFVCKLCNLTKNYLYSNKELDILNDSINLIESNNIKNLMSKANTVKYNQTQNEQKFEDMIELLNNNYLKENNNQYYGINIKLFDKLINEMAKIIGHNTNLSMGTDKHPIYLNNTVYIVDHTYNGVLVENPVIFISSDNRIVYRELHPYFNMDVYYYTDSRTIQVDVFYNAETRELLGYKELHKDYVVIQKSERYLKINLCIKEKLTILGHKNRYIDIADKYDKYITKDNKLHIYFVLDNLIKNHIISTRKVIDNFSSILLNIKYYKNSQNNENTGIDKLDSTKKLDVMISKYGQLLHNFNLGENDKSFINWINIKNFCVYKKVKWSETDVVYQKTYNCEKINYYDFSSNVMFCYLITQLIDILNANSDKKIKSHLSQLFIEIINYIYSETNNDNFIDSIELKREKFIINMIDMISIDLLKKGQGLDKSSKFDTQINNLADTDNLDPLSLDDNNLEIEDPLKEAEELDVDSQTFNLGEQEALDVEDPNFYFEDENEDYIEYDN